MKRVIFLLPGILLAGLVALSACARPAPTPSLSPTPTAKPAVTTQPPAPAPSLSPKPSPATAIYPEKNITWVLPVPPGAAPIYHQEPLPR